MFRYVCHPSVPPGAPASPDTTHPHHGILCGVAAGEERASGSVLVLPHLFTAFFDIFQNVFTKMSFRSLSHCFCLSGFF